MPHLLTVGGNNIALCLEWMLCSQHGQHVLSGEGSSDSGEMTKTIMICSSRKWSRIISYFFNTLYQTGHIIHFFYPQEKNVYYIFQPTSK